MKMTKRLILLLSATLLLSGCNGGTSDSTNNSESTTSSSDTPVTSSWSDDIKALLEKYCGDVLPYPSNGFVGEIKYQEVMDMYGKNCLQIYDKATSFTLKDIHWEYDLEASGWTIQKDYNGNSYKDAITDDGYVELTRISSDETKGFRLLFNYDSTTKCNLITCYNDLKTKLSTRTSFDDVEDGCIQYSLLTSLPFSRWGADYYVATHEYYELFFDENTVLIQDELAINNSDYTIKALEDDGFVLNASLSKANGLGVLYKELKNDENEAFANIQALVVYNGGNKLQATYLPIATPSSAWPSEFLKPIEEETGISLPTFTADDITSYGYYKKHDTYYVTANTSTSLSFDYGWELEDLGLFEDPDHLGTYTDWHEKVQIELTEGTDASYNTTSFTVALKAIKSEKTFADSYPSDKVADFLKNNNINVTPFSLDNTGTDIYRYTYTTDYEARYDYWYEYLKRWYKVMGMTMSEEEVISEAEDAATSDLGLVIEIADDDGSIADGLSDKFYKAGWHKETYYDNGSKFEDPDGELAVMIVCRGGITNIKIALGSGEKHKPVFEFTQSEIWDRPGNQVDLSNYLNIDMLPYTISYTSSDTSVLTVDEYGSATISESAKNNDSSIIKASITDKEGNTFEASITIRVTTITQEDIISQLKTRFESAVVKGTFNEEEDENNGSYRIYGAFLASELSVEEAKKYVEDNLILDNFSLSEYTPTWVDSNDYNTGDPYTYIIYCQGNCNIVQYLIYSDTYEGVDYTWIQMIIYNF